MQDARLYWLTFLGTLLVLSGRLSAQPALSPDRLLTQYVQTTWTSREGLPQNSVNALLQTRDGYLWVGTQEGLARFDGLRFTVFDRYTSTLPHNVVTALFEDRAGALWIGTQGGGLARWDAGRFTVFSTAQGLPGTRISAVAETPDGTLWVGTFDGGLARLRGNRFEHVRVPDPDVPDPDVTALAVDTEGALWVGTGNEGLYRQQPDGFARVEGLPAGGIQSLRATPTGALWVGLATGDPVAGGLVHIQAGKMTPFGVAEGLPPGGVRALWQDSGGTLWVGLDGGGLARWRGSRFDVLDTDKGLPHLLVRALLFDREGSLWVGTEGGLIQLSQGAALPIGVPEGLVHDFAFALHEDEQGALWVGTEGGLSRFENGRFTSFTEADGLPSDVVLSLASTPDGALWVGTYGGGLARFAEGRFTSFETGDGVSVREVFSLYTDRRGTLWIGTAEGLVRYRDGRFDALENLPSPLITALAEDPAGHLIVGSFDQGLVVLDAATGVVLQHLTADDGLGEGAVLSLHADAHAVWVALQGGGLSRLQAGQLKTVTVRQGLPTDTPIYLVEDTEGHLWMTSNRGLFRLSLRDLHAVADGQQPRLTATPFAEADGLRSREFNGGVQPAGWRTRSGQLWFPTTHGIVGLDPTAPPKPLPPPPVHLETLWVNGQAQPLGPGETRIPPGVRRLEFHYVGLSYIAPERVTFRYQLEGVDAEWVDAGTRREAFYTNLKPGAYTFRVQARTADGVWSDADAVVAVYLAPHFWETWWFMALCVLALTGLAVATYRARIAQLKARERHLEAVVEARTHDLRLEKERTEQAKAVIEAQAHKLADLDRFKTRFFANISHEFRTPLTLMLGPLENALSGAFGAVPAALQGQLEIMQRNALRLLRLINQLLDLAKLEAGQMELHARPRNVVDLVQGIVTSYSAFCEQKGLDLRFVHSAPAITLYYEPDKLEKVVFNLLSNAVKFTPAGGTLTVSVTEQPATADAPEGAVHIAVADTGRGIPPEKLALVFDRFRQVDESDSRDHEGTGIGLSMVQELVALHGGTVTVESTVGEGTTFTIHLKQGTAHLEAAQIVADDGAGETPALGQKTSNEALFTQGDTADTRADAATATSAPDDAPLVLVVDDNADLRAYITACLADTYRVAVAADGQEGLDEARRLHPDVILTDLMMPRLDGYGLIRAARADNALSHIPIILLTAKTSQETITTSLEAGADEYLAKPFNARELHARLRNLMTLRSQERELKDLNTNLAAKVREQVRTILTQRYQHEKQLLVEKERAEAALRFRSTLMDNMSHEFRTPLNAIIGYAQIFEHEAENEWQEFGTYIREGGERLLRTLNQVLELAAAASLPPPENPLLIALGSSVEAAAAPYRAAAEAKGLAWHLEAPEAPVWVQVAPEMLHRILGALFDNAVRFTRRGAITVTLSHTDDTARVAVRDTGIGIHPDFLPHLFEPFHQESQGLARAFEGTGLGLTLAQRYTEILGGHLAVESVKGEGSTFTLHLPLASLTPGGDGQPVGLAVPVA